MRKIKFMSLAAITASIFMLFQSCDTKETKSAAVETTREWSKDAIIYELNTRQFTPEGTFAAAGEHLPRLSNIVDILWFMPIYPIGVENRKGTLGSYYAVKDYKAINPEFGTLDDFKKVVKEAHKLGMKVIIDWVANHTSPDHVWVTSHNDWYKKDSAGKIIAPFDWTDVAQLNYDNKELWKEMINEMRFWIIAADIDGFRCDVAGMVPTAFWEEAVAELNKIKPVFMLAENEDVVALTDKAFDANYGWTFHHIMNRIYKGEQNVNNIWEYYKSEDTTFKPSVYRMLFTSNHDENSWNGTEFERLGNGAKAFAVLTYTLPGFPLIYNGQEVGFDKRLEFFEKDAIKWDNERASEFKEFYTTLNNIRKKNPALWNADNGGSLQKIKTNLPEKIVSFKRIKDNNTIITLINLSNQDQKVIFEKFDSNYIDLISGNSISIESKKPFEMPAWSYMILQ